ncbi:Mpt5p NDAI_0G03480 [Naumovozyma dairenensis CBS 421]|uniref:PUM-HD domain-containing protein n=1 Tax=Naumovozyma dairenensis (strain ATCC 10597 / BCRC 20456 / CBS 421 / NBRC 0211 / NRRL Y-12639) TaxID=1071378 RepID=G0WEB4_NAUDC|nr:hypothetical protein NDAI_0G03480 [Naumovozyma dairenensis CBS 421]CCD26125.2 hypothetical protein NDAI_0G03480 [Naumovozyma dairenensis CBS 421]
MTHNHQTQHSINSIQSLVEPVTPPPLGQMNNKRNHQKAHSLDLSGFNQFISSQSPMVLMNTVSTNDTTQASSNNGLNSSYIAAGQTPTILPQITEFTSSMNDSNSTISTQNNPRPFHDNNITTKSSVSAISLMKNITDGVASLPVASTTPSLNAKNNSSNNIGHHSNPSSSSSMAELALTPLKDLNYLKLATDQFGCRFLQKKLESPAESDIVRDLMYEEIKPYFLELILDPFGNYLIQKLCDYLTVDQRTNLIKSIYPNVFQISINQYGTRSLQRIIDTVDNDEQSNIIIEGFSQKYTSIEQIVTLINDLNGNHVIQKCIFKFPPSTFDFIIDTITEQNNIVAISTHKHGCCVLQKLLSVCTLDQIFKISVKLIQFLPALINDQFGNYIIQFLLDINEIDYYFLPEIFNTLSNELCQLSCLKFSSNVVEKFIKKLFSNVRYQLQMNNIDANTLEVLGTSMNILLSIVDIFTINLNILIRDNYGNYALQTLLDVKNYSVLLEYPGNKFVTNVPHFAEFSHEFTTKINNLVILTKELLSSIKTTSYAKKIKLKVKAYAELTGISFPDLSPKKPNNSNKNHYMNYNNTINSVNKNKNNSYQKQHSRHFSLPANAYHRRSSSSVIPSIFSQQQQQQQAPTQGQLSPGMNSIFNSHNMSPLGYQPHQSQPAQPITQPMLGQMNMSMPQQLPLQQDFSSSILPRPNSSVSLQSIPSHLTYPSSSSQLSIPQTFAGSDNNISTNSSSSMLYYPNNGINNFNDNMGNPLMSNLPFSSNNNFNQRQARIVSNPLPQPSFSNNGAFAANINPVSPVPNLFSSGSSNNADFINNFNFR